MTSPSRKKPRTTPLSIPPSTSTNWSFLGRLALTGVASLLILAVSTEEASSGELHWGSPVAHRRPALRRSFSQTVGFQQARPVRDAAVVAAVWEEDDAFVARAQATESRSVVVKRSKGPALPVDERFAQRPEDPFEQTDQEPVAEFDIEDPPIEEAERAIEQEIDRRQGKPEISDQDLFGDTSLESDTAAEDADIADLFEEEPMDRESEASQHDPFDEPEVDALAESTREDTLIDQEEGLERELESPQVERDLDELFDEAMEQDDSLDRDDMSELFENELLEQEPDDSLLLEEEEATELPDLELAPQPDYQEELDTELSDQEQEELRKEQEESQRNCQEELAKLRADTIDNIDLSIRLEGTAGEDFPYECTLDGGDHEPRCWPQITYNWKAAALCHKPLYFEQVQLERYGHSWGPYVQPIMSGVHFFGSIPILPYKMGIRTPTECVYTLGHYRPGSCAPYLINPVPFTCRAALFQGGVSTALPFIIP